MVRFVAHLACCEVFMVPVFWCSSSPQEDSQSHRSHKRKAPEDDDQPVIKRKTPDTWRYAYKMLKVVPS